jgi:hypothetical protein
MRYNVTRITRYGYRRKISSRLINTGMFLTKSSSKASLIKKGHRFQRPFFEVVIPKQLFSGGLFGKDPI